MAPILLLAWFDDYLPIARDRPMRLRNRPLRVGHGDVVDDASSELGLLNRFCRQDIPSWTGLMNVVSAFAATVTAPVVVETRANAASATKKT